jgi:hypothetical protein
VEVTSTNIAEALQYCSASDQRDDLKPGCLTWPIYYDPGAQRGQLTIWPADGRAAVALGGDSDWYDCQPAPYAIVAEDIKDDLHWLSKPGYDSAGILADWASVTPADTIYVLLNDRGEERLYLVTDKLALYTYGQSEPREQWRWH